MDQIEQPTDLGNLCHFLNSKACNAYSYNEETLQQSFANTSRNDRIQTCKQIGSHCASLIDVFERGDYPVSVGDAIILMRSGDRYLVSEGKHRVSAAIQLGLAAIPAQVRTTSDDLTPLPEIGQVGRWTAEYLVGSRMLARMWILRLCDNGVSYGNF